MARREQLRRFLTWLAGKASQVELAGSARSFRRDTAWCWAIRPRLHPIGQVHRAVIVDGIWIGSWCLLIAIADTGQVLAWQWCAGESTPAWAALLHRLPAPNVIVSDGGTGLRSAIGQVWPDTKIQRCVFHLQMNVTRELTRNPRTPAGRALRAIAMQLSDVCSIQEAIAWQQRLNDWWHVFGHLTKQRTMYADGQFGFTHERLRKAWFILQRVARAGHAFTHLEHACPRTTSALEGGINAPIRDLLRRHRGMPAEHRRRAVEWFLTLHETTLDDALDYANRPQPQPVKRPDDQISRVLYDRGTSAEEGLWTRHGWAGRS